ncbi:MAG: hypothetical protein H7259_09015 [Cytophagales bacterium]|nr:hypothetical protein [Cytophaga sp.]
MWCLAKGVHEDGTIEMEEHKGEEMCLQLNEDSTYVLLYEGRISVWENFEGKCFVRHDSLFWGKNVLKIVSIGNEELILQNERDNKKMHLSFSRQRE